MSTHAGWVLLCLASAWMVQPQAVPARFPRHQHQRIALKETRGQAVPEPRERDLLRLTPAEPQAPGPGLPVQGLAPGCRF